MENAIMFINGESNFMSKAVLRSIRDANLEVIEVQTDISEIKHRQYEADIILFYMSDAPQIDNRIMTTISNICKESRKLVSLIGTPESLAAAQKEFGSEVISKTYTRPIDVRKIVDDLREMLNAHMEYIRKKHILLVDDDPDFLQIATSIFENTYYLDAMPSAKEAFNYLTVRKPDLILLDYEMPDMDGYEFFAEIRRSWKTSNIPVIFLTGKDDKESVMKIIDKKPDGYLLKSTPKQQLLESIDKFFADYILG